MDEAPLDIQCTDPGTVHAINLSNKLLKQGMRRNYGSADDRYDGVDLAGSVTAAEADRMQFYEAALHINRLYAARHGYRFTYQGAGKYAPNGFRHMSWMKLQMLRDELECCCQWALFMDSDSFLVMADHEVSIEAWLTKDEIPVVTTLLGNMYPMPGLDSRLRKGAEPVAVISDNVPWTATSYFCAGNMLFTRTQLSFEILDYWFNKTIRLDPSSLKRHPWEQKMLNKFVMHKYSRAFWVVPSSEMNSFDGSSIRHLWSPYGEATRTKLSVQHLKQVLQRQ